MSDSVGDANYGRPERSRSGATLANREGRAPLLVRFLSATTASDPARASLASWLKQPKSWSDKNPKHAPLTVHLDLKNAPTKANVATYAAALDKYLGDAIGHKRVYTPGELMGNFPDLVTAGRKRGWPDVSKLKGRVLICLSGGYKRKHHYAMHKPKRRLCFVDHKWASWNQAPPKAGH